MIEISDYLSNFIDEHVMLIDTEQWEKLFRLCNPYERSNLKKVLKASGINPVITPEVKDWMPIEAASKYVQDFVKSLFSFRYRYNDKGKTGRKLKWVDLSLNVDKDKLEDIVRDELDKNNIKYDYVLYDPNYMTSSGFRTYVFNVLYVRLLDPEVSK